MRVEQFLKQIKYKPKYVTKPFDGVQNIEFRHCHGFNPYIEFGVDINDEKGGYYFYYEILDLNAYKDMEFIPIDSKRRHDTICCWPKSKDEYRKIAKYVNESLKKLYARNKDK